MLRSLASRMLLEAKKEFEESELHTEKQKLLYRFVRPPTGRFIKVVVGASTSWFRESRRVSIHELPLLSLFLGTTLSSRPRRALLSGFLFEVNFAVVDLQQFGDSILTSRDELLPSFVIFNGRFLKKSVHFVTHFNVRIISTALRLKCSTDNLFNAETQKCHITIFLYTKI